MSEPDISTLARRLAEQNNVDWRALSGSGPEGKVVERDVLDFLARVMAGEEATDPTPEPLPAGMDAWPDQDLDGLRADVGEAGTLGDLRGELGRSALPDEPAAAGDPVGEVSDDVFGDIESVPFGSAAASVGAAVDGETESADRATETAGGEVDEDIFLFDDEETEPLPGAAAAGWSASETAGASGAGDMQMEAAGDLDDLLVAGDEFDQDDDLGEAEAGTDLGSPYSAETVTEPLTEPDFGNQTGAEFGALETVGFEQDEGDEDGFGLGLADEPMDLAAASSATALTDGATQESDDVWGSGISLGDDRSSFGTSSGSVDDASDLWGAPAETEETADDLWSTASDSTATDESAEQLVSGATEPPPAAEEPVPEEPAPATASWGAADDDLTASVDVAADVLPDDLAPAGFGSDEIGTDDIGAEQIEADEIVSADIGAADIGAADIGAEEGVEPVMFAADLPVSRSATILRRHIDLSALASSQLSVGNELGYDEPLAVAPFLLRAVAKAAATIEVPAEHVALAQLGDGLTLRRVRDSAERSFSSLVSELAEEAVIEDEPQLVAADLSALDLDEALLDLDVPVVTLGRILYDNQRGAYRSTLTLTGELKPDLGARLLARVAELLDAPVRLVL